MPLLIFKKWFILLLTCCAFAGRSQTNWNDLGMKGALSADTLVRKGYTLIFINNDAALDRKVRQGMIETFFAVYPKEVALFNPASLKKVILIMDTAYKGVAATDNGIVRVNPEWMHRHPEDLDVVTHEVMHIVQAYPEDAGPGWITEGIADYARYVFGINNDAGGWALPALKKDQSYENAYRVTARFFAWIEKHEAKGLVKKLDKAMRTKTYTSNFWKQTTGNTVDELWAVYAADPVL